MAVLIYDFFHIKKKALLYYSHIHKAELGMPNLRVDNFCNEYVLDVQWWHYLVPQESS